LVIAGIVAIVVGWILLAATDSTNTVCSSIGYSMAPEYYGVSAAQCAGAAIGNGVGVALAILGAALLLSGILAGIYAVSGGRTR
jgi:hypothetical protein